jgi:hypothetical protein
MLSLWQWGTLGCVIISEHEFLIRILIVIGIHQQGFRQAGVHKLPKVQLRSITELKYTGDEAS